MQNQSYHDFEMLLAEKASRNLLETKAIKGHTHIAEDILDLSSLISGKCALVHSHSISEIQGLQSLLQSFASSNHTHMLDELPEIKKQITDMNSQIGIITSQLYHLNSLISELQGNKI
jgi:hypothetical protein